MATNGRKNAEKAREPVDVERLWHIWNMNGPDLSLSCEICSFLEENMLPYELDIFMRNLPLEEEYLVNETLNRARAKVAFWREDFESVYSILKNNSFSSTEDLIELWDLCHYKEEENRRQKPLTPLMRFRIRQRFTPPATILPSGIRKKATLPKESTDILRLWFSTNQKHPYPSRETKIMLAQQTALTKSQVSTWFSNARRRFYRGQMSTTTTKKKSKHKKYHVDKGTAGLSSPFLRPEITRANQVPSTDSTASADPGCCYSNLSTNPHWSCDAHETGLSKLLHQVSHCLAKPFVCAEDFRVKDEQDSMYREELNPYQCCSGPDHAITLAMESRGHQSTNQDAAQILIDLSSKIVSDSSRDQ